jgi:hypothetical protein
VVREIESEMSPSQTGQEIDQDESNSEDSSEGWDDSDSDTEPSEDEEMTEEQRQHEREQRELERIRVLEAAGLIIKQPAEGKTPPAPPVRRRSTKKGRRPPPLAPAPSLPATTSDRERELPPLPPLPPHRLVRDWTMPMSVTRHSKIGTPQVLAPRIAIHRRLRSLMRARFLHPLHECPSPRVWGRPIYPRCKRARAVVTPAC